MNKRELFSPESARTDRESLRGYIFSHSNRSNKPTLSENRYLGPPDSEILLNTWQTENSKALLPHRRQNSHQRKPSICGFEDSLELGKNKALHSRTSTKGPPSSKECPKRRQVSDFDSVLLTLPDEKENLRISLPIFGVTPCATFCHHCKTIVQTEVTLESNAIPGVFLGFLSSLLACYAGPTWLHNLRTHRCPNCCAVLAGGR